MPIYANVLLPFLFSQTEAVDVGNLGFWHACGARGGLKYKIKMDQCDLLHCGGPKCRAMDAVHRPSGGEAN